MQKLYPYPEVWKKSTNLIKKLFCENCWTYSSEKLIDFAPHHTWQLIRFPVWSHSYFFQNNFFINPFLGIFVRFRPNMPYISLWGKCQVQDFAFLTSEMKSTLNFSLENMFYIIFWQTLSFLQFVTKMWVRSRTLSYIGGPGWGEGLK